MWSTWNHSDKYKDRHTLSADQRGWRYLWGWTFHLVRHPPTTTLLFAGAKYVISNLPLTNPTSDESPSLFLRAEVGAHHLPSENTCLIKVMSLWHPIKAGHSFIIIFSFFCVFVLRRQSAWIQLTVHLGLNNKLNVKHFSPHWWNNDRFMLKTSTVLHGENSHWALMVWRNDWWANTHFGNSPNASHDERSIKCNVEYDLYSCSAEQMDLIGLI